MPLPPDDNRRRYEQWVGRWAGDLYRFAYRLCGRRDLADDLVQETFYHAWRSIHTLRDDASAKPWLFQILRHRWSHAVRTDLRHPMTAAPLDAVAEAADDHAAQPLAVMARDEAVRKALAALDERYRVALLLVFVEGLTCREAAEQLGVPLGTVLSRIHRARAAMRLHLSDADRDEYDVPADRPSPQPPRLWLDGAG